MIISSDANLGPLLVWLTKQKTLAYDIETTGLNVRKDQIIGFALSNGAESWYVAHQVFLDGSLQTAVSKSKCANILRLLKGKKLITWNGSFDLRFTANYFDVNLLDSLWSEGMLAKHTVDEERPFALKEVAAQVFGAEAAQEQQDLLADLESKSAGKSEMYKANLDILGKYAMQDTLLTYKLNDHFLQEIERQGLTKFYFEDEVMPLYREVTIPMESHGIMVDLPLLQRTRAEIEEDINILDKKIRELVKAHLRSFELWFLNKDYPPKRTGPFVQALAELEAVDLPRTDTGKFSLTAKNIEKLPDCLFKRFFLGTERLTAEKIEEVQRHIHGPAPMLNLSSKFHLKKIFFDELGETPLSLTETGLPQVDDEFLESIADKYEFVKLLLDYNKLCKIKSSYIDRLLEENEDSIWYPSFHQHRTISGRYGSDAQQFPRLKEPGELSPLVLKYNNIVRKFLISRPGRTFVDADYESLEPHIFAHVSGDDGLKDIFRNGWDFYSTIAIRTEGLTQYSPDKKADNYLGKLDKPKRQAAKAYSLGIPYGMGAFALGKNLEISEPQAKRLVDGYLNAFPKLKQWMEESKQLCLTKGISKSEAGRVRHMPKAVNIYKAYGDTILDPLELWSKYGDNSSKYKQMKYLYSEIKNYVNNSRNFQIQSLSASIVNRACIALNRYMKATNGGLIVMQTHDQICIEVDMQYADQMVQKMQEIMENVYKISLPLKAPAKAATNMADSH